MLAQTSHAESLAFSMRNQTLPARSMIMKMKVTMKASSSTWVEFIVNHGVGDALKLGSR
jgi:hypothetical protein